MLKKKMELPVQLRCAIALIVLTILGFLGNYFSLSLFFGVNIIFGSIFILIIIQIFGPFWGTAAAVISSSYTFVLWNHPFGIIVFTCEALFLGLVLKKKNINMVLVDTLYWVLIGAPLVYFLYKGLYMNMDNEQILLVILKDALNGTLNALFATLIITVLPIRKWIFPLERKRAIPLNHMLFSLVVGCVLLPALSISILQGNDKFKRVHEQTRAALKTQAFNISNVIDTWYKERMKAFSLIADNPDFYSEVENSRLQEHITLIHKTFSDFHTLFVADDRGTTVAFSPTVNEAGESTIGLNFSDRAYFIELKEVQRPIVSDVFVARGGVSLPIVTLNVPVMREEKFAGIVTGGVDLEQLSKLIDIRSENPDTIITIVDRKNNVIASNDSNIKVMEQFTYLYENCIDEGSGYFRLIPDKSRLPSMQRSKRTFFAYEKELNDIIGWRIIQQVPFRTYQQNLEDYYIRNFLIIFFLMLVAFLFAYVLGKLFTDPIAMLAEATTRLPGKLTSQTNIKWPRSAIQEIETLIGNFRATAVVLKKLVGRDSLTNLPNRLLFKERLDEALSIARKSGRKLAVIFIDMDRFKSINDMFGHAIGDMILKEAARRLQNSAGKDCTLCRIGGDEFILLMPEIMVAEDAAGACQRILNAMQRPYEISGYKLEITTSMGIAMYPDDSDSGESLLKNSDIAMYHAKGLGKNNYQFFSPLMNGPALKKLTMENKLRGALRNGEFMLYYQPQVDINSREVIGMEALIRWKNPELGFVPPDEFIPLAEETGLIVQLGEWVLRTACAQNKAWQDLGYRPIPVSVNISVCQFLRQGFIKSIVSALDQTGLHPQWLELEITESIIIKDIELTNSLLDTLNNLGIKVSLDDFGTGFSSLGYLKNFKIDTLKIDSSFIKDIEHSDADAAIVSTIITLARNLKLNVVAEGVENKDQLRYLEEQGCDKIQGYFFSRPLPPQECVGFLKKEAPGA